MHFLEFLAGLGMQKFSMVGMPKWGELERLEKRERGQHSWKENELHENVCAMEGGGATILYYQDSAAKVMWFGVRLLF